VIEFVNYIYSDKISEDFSDLEELLKIGHKYEVFGLVEECSKRLSRKLTVDNVVQLGCLAESYQVSNLSDSCAEFLTENLEEVDPEKLDTAPAPLLRKALTAAIKGKPPAFEISPLPVTIKTQYPANFFTNLANTEVIAVNIPIETYFKVSRETKLAGVGIYLNRMLCRIPIEFSLIKVNPLNIDSKYTLTTVSTEIVPYSISSLKPRKLMFPIPVEVDSVYVYKLEMKLGTNVSIRTGDGNKHRLSIPMKEILEITIQEPCPQIPVLYFEG